MIETAAPDEDDSCWLPSVETLVFAARGGVPLCAPERAAARGAERVIIDARGPVRPTPRRVRLEVLQVDAAGPIAEISGAPDKYALTELPEIDCEARLHLCRARCCALSFTLSQQDVDEGVVRWDPDRPYRIARRPDKYCVHNEGARCTVYAHRPAVCRSYDCRADPRIWKDFAQRIPAF